MNDKGISNNADKKLPPQLSKCENLYRLFSVASAKHQLSIIEDRAKTTFPTSAILNKPNVYATAHENAELGKALIDCQLGLFAKFTEDADFAAQEESSREFMQRSLSGDSGW